jgi:hypothetical protein
MQVISGVATALASELSDRLGVGGLAAPGPVCLMAGVFANAELAGRVLLAEMDHLGALAEHTGEPAADDRWALLVFELGTLLRLPRAQVDASTGSEPSPRP